MSADLLKKLSRHQEWDEAPVFCFTTDIDWASEAVISQFLKSLPIQELKMTAFVTHFSPIIEELYATKVWDRGIHPFFLKGSSHGDNFKEIIENCIAFAPEAESVRSHRLYNVSDTAHLLFNEFGFRYCSNTIMTLSSHIRPYLHESKMIDIPIFWEEGTALYNQLGLSIDPYLGYFTSPGLKVISFHPINVVFNTPEIAWMRKIKDSMSREEYNQISSESILKNRNNAIGIYHTIMEIVNLVKQKNYKILSLKEIYNNIVN